MQPQVDEPPPPPAPANTLPPDWKSAKDAEGRTYYYHKVTRQTQWEVPRAVEEKSAEPAKTKKVTNMPGILYQINPFLYLQLSLSRPLCLLEEGYFCTCGYIII